MTDTYDRFREKLNDLCLQWRNGLPGRQTLLAQADDLAHWKQRQGVTALWSTPPRMVTATIDDGIGQGISMINRYARLLGLELTDLGLLQPPQAIAAACRRIQPAWLGLTVLQLDSEDDLHAIATRLPAMTQIIAGGPALVIDPDMAARTGVHHTARNLAAFLDIMLA